MSPEESQLLKALFDRVKTASSTPRDQEAETLIQQSVQDVPQAPYYLAQAVIVQEKGLEAAAAHIRQLEERIHHLESGNPDPHHVTQGGFLSSIFGSNEPQAPAPRNPAPRNDIAGQTQGPWGRSPSAQQGGPWQTRSSFAPSTGGSFLQGALGTAAGVAGGMLLANSLSGIFGNHMSSLGLGSTADNATEKSTAENDGDDNPQQADNNTTDDNDDDLRQADDDFDGSDDFGGDDVSDA